jgi:hypothetical protein
MIRRGKNAIFIPDNIDKNTDAHTKYVIIIALPLQQWLRERASILRYMYNAYLISLSTLVGKDQSEPRPDHTKKPTLHFR